MDDAGQKVAVLHHDRLIEVQLAAHAGDVRRRDALPGQGAGGVAWNHVHTDEGDQADAEEQRDQEQNAPRDVGGHGSLVSRRGGARWRYESETWFMSKNIGVGLS